MFIRTLKTVAIATALVAATASASMAATWAWVDYDAKVRKHAGAGVVVNWVEEGQKVKVIDKKQKWYKLQIPGNDGWVHADVLNWSKPGPFPFPGDYGYGYGGSFCVNGTNASFCLSAGY
jgi:SH3-like domain-containing protein